MGGLWSSPRRRESVNVPKHRLTSARGFDHMGQGINQAPREWPGYVALFTALGRMEMKCWPN